MGLFTAIASTLGYEKYKDSQNKGEGPAPQRAIPANYVYADGTRQIYDAATNTYTFVESPEAKQTRLLRNQQRDQVLASLTTTDPARVAQLEEYRNTFYDELVQLTVDPLERKLLQRGLAGSIQNEQVAKGRAEAGKQAIFAKESLMAQDQQSKLAQLGLLEGGASADFAQQLQSANLAQQGLAQSQAYNLGQQQIDMAGDQFKTQQKNALLGSGASAIGSLAFLAAMSDRRMKEGIKQVSVLPNGIPIYTYRFRGSNMTQMGVMAQDVEKIMPEAVETINGIKHVRYDLLDQVGVN